MPNDRICQRLAEALKARGVDPELLEQAIRVTRAA
jgi:hypothetical protein